MTQPRDNGHRIRRHDKIGYHVKDNWYIFLFLVPIAWALVTDHFTIYAQAAEINTIKETIKEQAREQSRNQREINQKLTDQATTNGRIEATQDAIQRQIQHLINLTNRRNVQ